MRLIRSSCGVFIDCQIDWISDDSCRLNGRVLYCTFIDLLCRDEIAWIERKLMKHREWPKRSLPFHVARLRGSTCASNRSGLFKHTASLPHPTMANRQGYDVVVDVDAEVCNLHYHSRAALKKPNTNTETGRPWPYRPPRRQPRVPQL